MTVKVRGFPVSVFTYLRLQAPSSRTVQTPIRTVPAPEMVPSAVPPIPGMAHANEMGRRNGTP